MTDLRKASEMTQSEALRLSDALDDEFVQGRISNYTARNVATELRRLHEENEQLRQALAQPEQEPDWGVIAESQLEAAKTALNKSLEDATVDAVHKLYSELQEPVAWMKPSGLISPYKHGSYTIPLYTALPKREWVGLTDDEIHEMIMRMRTKNMGVIMTEEIFRDVEAKLREKNGE